MFWVLSVLPYCVFSHCLGTPKKLVDSRAHFSALSWGQRAFGGGGGVYGMVWYALRYRERLAGRSLTLPVYRAGGRGRGPARRDTRLLPSWLGGGGCRCCAHPSLSPRAPASCAGPVPVVPVQCVPPQPMPKITRTGRAYWYSCKRPGRCTMSVGSPQSPMGLPAC